MPSALLGDRRLWTSVGPSAMPITGPVSPVHEPAARREPEASPGMEGAPERTSCRPRRSPLHGGDVGAGLVCGPCRCATRSSGRAAELLELDRTKGRRSPAQEAACRASERGAWVRRMSARSPSIRRRFGPSHMRIAMDADRPKSRSGRQERLPSPTRRFSRGAQLLVAE